MLNTIKRKVNTGDQDFFQIIKHASSAFIVLGIATFTQFIFDLLLARNFGAEGAGVFYLSLSILSLLALLARLGLDKSIVRFLPPLLLDRDWNAARGLVSTTSRIILYNCILLTVFMFFSASYISEIIFSNKNLAQYIRILSLSLIPFSFTYFYSGQLRAMKKIKEALFVERVVLYLCGIIVAISVLGSLFGLVGVAWGFVASSYTTAIMGYLISSRHLPRTSQVIPFDKRKLYSSATPLLFSAFANLMFGQVNILLLGSLAQVEDVGVFNIALKASLFMGLVLVGINSISGTKISELYSKNKSLESLASKTAALSLSLALPLFLVYVLFPHIVLSFFGNDFTAGSGALIMLAFGQLFSVGVGSANYILAMTGNEKTLAKIVFMSLVLNASLSSFLIPHFGINGAAFAISVSMIASNIVQVVMIKRILGIWSLPFKTILRWLR